MIWAIFECIIYFYGCEQLIIYVWYQVFINNFFQRIHKQRNIVVANAAPSLEGGLYTDSGSK